MTPTAQEKAAVHSPKLTAAFQTNYPARRGEQGKFATDADALESLRRHYLAFGLSLFQLAGRALVVTGAGLPTRTMPDTRCAWLYLRQLRGTA